MHSRSIEILHHAVADYGYLAVGVALLLENAGVPIPGETVLLLASFLAYSEHALKLPWIIATGIVTATVGDNVGYFIGYRGGRPLLDRYRQMFRIRRRTIARGERIFARYGPVTVLFARFVFGMRVIAGPLAGVLRMPWRRFVPYNFLGASLWVSVIAGVGYFFGANWEQLAHGLNRIGILAATAALLFVLYFWWRRRQTLGPNQQASDK